MHKTSSSIIILSIGEGGGGGGGGGVNLKPPLHDVMSFDNTKRNDVFVAIDQCLFMYLHWCTPLSNS